MYILRNEYKDSDSDSDSELERCRVRPIFCIGSDNIENVSALIEYGYLHVNQSISIVLQRCCIAYYISNNFTKGEVRASLSRDVDLIVSKL